MCRAATTLHQPFPASLRLGSFRTAQHVRTPLPEALLLRVACVAFQPAPPNHFFVRFLRSYFTFFLPLLVRVRSFSPFLFYVYILSFWSVLALYGRILPNPPSGNIPCISACERASTRNKFRRLQTQGTRRHRHIRKKGKVSQHAI